jgi:hypothetical protein
MGYSATKAAIETLEHIERTFQSPDTKSQVMRFNGADYYFECGRENEDGAVTGTLHKFTSIVLDSSTDVYARSVGSVRISSDGTIERFPYLPSCFMFGFDKDGYETHEA